MYSITYAQKAQDGLRMLKQNEPAAFRKAIALLNEIIEHPRTGTGHPEPLRWGTGERWSRRITKKHRLVYRIFETEVYVDVLSAYGHYEDR